jgi:hypothetical protein
VQPPLSKLSRSKYCEALAWCQGLPSNEIPPMRIPVVLAFLMLLSAPSLAQQPEIGHSASPTAPPCAMAKLAREVQAAVHTKPDITGPATSAKMLSPRQNYVPEAKPSRSKRSKKVRSSQLGDLRAQRNIGQLISSTDWWLPCENASQIIPSWRCEREPRSRIAAQPPTVRSV